MRKLPLKMNILKTIIDCGQADEEMIFSRLEPVYGNERQFSRGAVENHLLALLAVGLICEASVGGGCFYTATNVAGAKMEKFVRG